jgi:hypothetical protein
MITLKREPEITLGFWLSLAHVEVACLDHIFYAFLSRPVILISFSLISGPNGQA